MRLVERTIIVTFMVAGCGRAVAQPVPVRAVELRAAFETRRSVSVLVELQIDGLRPDPVALVDQRDRIRQAQLDFLASQGRRVDESVRLFATIPYLAMSVSADQAFRLFVAPMQFETTVAAVTSRVDYSISVDRPLRPATLPPRAAASRLKDVLETMRVSPLHATGVTGRGQTVVVIDTGVELNDPFLAERITDGSDQSAPRASCTIGVKATWRGRVFGGAPDRPTGELPHHGTRVAGASCGRAHGWLGLAPGAEVVSIRVDEANSKAIPTTHVIGALEEVYCHWAKARCVAAVVVSLSDAAGGHAAPCGTLSSAAAVRSVITNLAAIGVPVVVAAGNEWGRNALSFPACLTETIAVGALTADGSKAWDVSNWDASLDFVAPGLSVFVTENIDIGPGTSISAPLVAGAIALLRSKHSSCDYGLILEALAETGVNRGPTGQEVRLPQLDLAVAWLDAHCPEENHEETACAPTPPR